MSFNHELNALYDNAISISVEQAGYKPHRLDREEHNNKIDDEIIASIRRSRFIVADLTKQSHGVYFEAGYALSLGIPLIWMCEKGTSVHFDVGQFPRIMWEDENELYEKLKKKIEGSIF